MKRERQEMKKGILSISYLLIVLMIAALTACGGLKGPMIPKSSIPAAIDADVKNEIERLYSSSSSKRENGAHNLGIIGKEAAPAVPFLIDMLKDKDEDVRVNAAIALGKIGDPRSVEPLIIALKDEDEDEEVRGPAAIALGDIKDPRAVEPLIVALKLIAESSEEEKLIGKNAAIALGKIGDPRAIEPLISAMKDEEKGLKEKVVRNMLFGIFYAPIGLVYGTIQSVKITGGIKERDMGEQWSVAWAIADIGKPAVEPLIAALNNKDSDEYIRKRAPVALWKIGDPRAVEPLIAALKDEDVYVRKSAKEALEKISGNNLGQDHAKWQAWWAENKNKQLASPGQ